MLTSPTGNTRGPLHAEPLLRTLHQQCRAGEPAELVLLSREGTANLAADLPRHSYRLIADEFRDAYPGMAVKPDQREPTGDGIAWSTELHLRPDIMSLRLPSEFTDIGRERSWTDPLAGVFASLRSGRSGRMECESRLLIRPARKSRVREAERIAIRADRMKSLPLRRFFLQASTIRIGAVRLLVRLLHWPQAFGPSRADDLPAKFREPLFECRLRITVTAPPDAEKVTRRKLADITAAYGRFTDAETAFVSSRVRQGNQPQRGRGFLLGVSEVAILWHPLTESADGVSRVERPDFREVEPAVSLGQSRPSTDTTVLGRVLFREQRNQFGINIDDFRRHLIAVGKTGCGKSTFLLSVVRQQMEAGRGVVLIDPHGQLAEAVLDVVPRSRTNDVVYFDASDRKYPVGFNPLLGPSGTDPTLVADGVLTAFKQVFGLREETAPRLLHIFRNCLLALVGTPEASLDAVGRLLVDSNFRRSVTGRVTNEAVRQFWSGEFGRWSERDRTQYIASLQNKLGAFTTNERLRAILNPAGEGIKLREVIDDSKILICNLSKGTVGHDASTLLGSLLLSSLQVAAMSRANIPESDRTDCVAVVDEFHTYLSEGNPTMADALAESRKYRVSYVLATQLLEQLDSHTLAAVLGNCGSTLAMTVGPRDAVILSELLGSGLTPDDLMRIPKYHGYMRLLVKGVPRTFSMTTLPPQPGRGRRREVIRRVSRQRYGQHPTTVDGDC
ncbi:type IV secretory system conjugative DNA transfer family protein [Stratiformator vulcanicus]|uniref:type IV secretory system conjugative DNA transfer family protein n=1 Tax=Stratiformator vulcanicus TaxID=2527980 RepID=UPI0028775367|nr:DUF87 domain-containing protein [Stratiformator vulcanicus]